MKSYKTAATAAKVGIIIILLSLLCAFLTSCNTHDRKKHEEKKALTFVSPEIPNKMDRGFNLFDNNLLIEIDTISGEIFITYDDTITGISYMRIYDMISLNHAFLDNESLKYKEERKSKWLDHFKD
jgi:hypothetical protein